MHDTARLAAPLWPQSRSCTLPCGSVLGLLSGRPASSRSQLSSLPAAPAAGPLLSTAGCCGCWAVAALLGLFQLTLSAPAAAAVAPTGPAVVPWPNLHTTKHMGHQFGWDSHTQYSVQLLRAVASRMCTLHCRLHLHPHAVLTVRGYPAHPAAPDCSAWPCPLNCCSGILLAAGVLLLLSMARSCFRKFSSVLVASAAGVLRWPNIPLGPKRDPGAAEGLPDAPFDAAAGPEVDRQPHHMHCVGLLTMHTSMDSAGNAQPASKQEKNASMPRDQAVLDIPVITWLQASQNVFVPRTAAQQSVLCSRLPSRMHVVTSFHSSGNAFHH